MIKIKLIIASLVLTMGVSGIAYAKNEKQKTLPPGLQKKVESGKSLPPGWQKKLAVGEVLSQDVYEHGKILVSDTDKGLVTINVDGKLIRVIEHTREIVEILDGL